MSAVPNPSARFSRFAAPPGDRQGRPIAPSRVRSDRALPSQALVEFAFVMPVLFGLTTALLQMGIIFMVYLAMIHSTRDVARWLAVHPDTTDADVETYIAGHLPSILIPGRLDFTALSSSDPQARPWAPTCASLDSNGRCASRPAGSAQTIALTYDAAGHLFLPNQWNFGGVIYTIPSVLPRYSYTVMIEPR